MPGPIGLKPMLKLSDIIDHSSDAAGADLTQVVSLFTDGGVVVRNPSPVGGTFAVRLVDAGGTCLVEGSGAVTLAELAPLPWVGNNLTEVAAVTLGLELLPDGWAGTVYTDSLNALRRCRDCLSQQCPPWLPADLWGRLYAARRRLGDLTWVLLSGHPTADELAAGLSKKGRPVSPHNVAADDACRDQAARMMARHEAARAGGPKVAA